MNQPVIRRVLQGFGVNAYGQLVIIAIQILGLPIFLEFWGVQLYGEWLILFAMPAFLSMVDLGFSQSAANEMTAKVARGDKESALTIFQSLIGLVTVTFTLITFIVIGVILLFQVDSFSILSDSDVRWVLLSLSIGALIKLFGGVTDAGFRCNGEYPLHQFIYLTGLLFQHTLVWGAVILGYGVIEAGFIFLLVSIVQILFTFWLLKKRHRWLILGIGNANLNCLRLLISPSFANMSMPLAQAINIQGMIIVIGATLGPVAVVLFSTLRTLTRFVTRLVVAVGQATEPELAAAYGNSNMKLLQRLYLHSNQAAFWMASVGVLMLLLFGNDIVLFWSRGTVNVNYPLFFLLLFSATLSVLWYGGLTLLKAANRHLRVSVAYVVASVLAVLIAKITVDYTQNIKFAGVSLVLMDILMIAFILKKTSEFAKIKYTNILLSLVDIRSIYTNISKIFR